MWLQVVCESVSKIALVLEQVGGGADEEGAAALRTTNGDIIAAAKHIKLDRLTRFVLIVIIFCLFISSAPEKFSLVQYQCLKIGPSIFTFEPKLMLSQVIHATKFLIRDMICL